MNKEIINNTEAFLRETFANSTCLQLNPSEAEYRLEHSYRVANIAKEIALAEGFDVTQAVVAGLLLNILHEKDSYLILKRNETPKPQYKKRSAITLTGNFVLSYLSPVYNKKGIFLHKGNMTLCFIFVLFEF